MKKQALPNLVCNTCKYYNPDGDGQVDQGVCHRFPPQQFPVMVQGLQGVQQAIQSKFTVVKANAWCGEHRPKLEQ